MAGRQRDSVGSNHKHSLKLLMKFYIKWLKGFAGWTQPLPSGKGGDLRGRSSQNSALAPVMGDFPNVFVGEVLRVDKHPNADRLRLVAVSLGDRLVEPIVCGAFNFDVGDLVVLALPGAQIVRNIHTAEHEPFVLKKATIRGIESQGMICAAFELGAGSPTDKPEIVVVTKPVSPGAQFSSKMLE